jgi:peptide-methionine (R)-S-oxide reductase
MPSRRQFFVALGSALTLGPLVAWLTGPSRSGRAMAESNFPVQKPDAQWRRELTDDQYAVLRDHDTEPAFTSPLNDEKRSGTYVCAGCDNALFASSTKFESGTGWPSFWQPLPNAVGTEADTSFFMVRTEVHCAQCGGHLGHVFNDGPKPTGLRYCINGLALEFRPA